MPIQEYSKYFSLLQLLILTNDTKTQIHSQTQ